MVRPIVITAKNAPASSSFRATPRGTFGRIAAGFASGAGRRKRGSRLAPQHRGWSATRRSPTFTSREAGPRMRILITGGAGFIGSAVIRHVIAETDVEVVNVDCLTYAGHLTTLQTVETNPRYQFEHVNICDTREM